MATTMSKYTISAIPCTLVELLWPQLEPHIQRATDLVPFETYTAAIKERLLSADTMALTVSIGTDIIAVITLEVREFDTGNKALFMPIVGGNEMFEWFDQCMSVIEAIAKDMGCQELRGLAARSGWMRVLKDKGWSEVYVTVRRPLSGD